MNFSMNTLSVSSLKHTYTLQEKKACLGPEGVFLKALRGKQPSPKIFISLMRQVPHFIYPLPGQAVPLSTVKLERTVTHLNTPTSE